MDWDKLKVFHAAAEAGSFTHAGEQLGLSQSAVSRQVSALEQELSAPLFHRHARGLILTEQELDLAMREADVAIRLRLPTQPDLIQRKLFTMHFHAYASPEYIKRFGTPRSHEDLDHHRLLVLGGSTVPTHLRSSGWLIDAGRDGKGPRTPWFTINNILGLLRACQRGVGVAMLPDYLVEENGGLVQLFGDVDDFTFDAFFVYPEELKSVARIQVFRDFLVAKAQQWNF